MTLSLRSLLCVLLFSVMPLASVVADEAMEPAPFEELRDFLEAAEEDPNAIFGIVDAQRELGASEELLVHAESLGMIWTSNFSRAPGVVAALAQHVAEDGPLLEGGLFASKEERVAFLHLLRARIAYDSNDAPAFEEEAKEAYWRDPFLGEIMAPWIEAYRDQLRMESLRFPLDHSMTDSTGTTTTLAALMGENRAVLLDFWATWCGPCIALMPELVSKGEKLGPQGILVAGMNTENAAKAEQFRVENAIELTWLVEPSDRPFSNLLGVDSIPRMVLVGREGQILFNGHPMDPALETALAGVGAEL